MALSGWDTEAVNGGGGAKEPEAVYIPVGGEGGNGLNGDAGGGSSGTNAQTSSTSQKPPPQPYKPRRPTPPRRVATNLDSILRKSTVQESDSTVVPPEDENANAGEVEGDAPVEAANGTVAAGRRTSELGRGMMSKFQGHTRKASVAPGNDEESEQSRRRAEAVNKARMSMLGKAGQGNIDLNRLRKQRMAEGGAHRSGLEGEKAKEDFLSSLVRDMNVLDENSKARYIALSNPLFKDKDVLSMQEMADGLQRMGRDVSGEEVEFIKKVFDLVSGDFVDQAEFCVVAALAERMTLLEYVLMFTIFFHFREARKAAYIALKSQTQSLIQTSPLPSTNLRMSFYDTDFKKLEKSIKQFRGLFTAYTQDNVTITYEDLRILLLSTGIPQQSIESVAALLGITPQSDPLAPVNLPADPHAKSNVGFLDFLSYVPFFTVLHESIVENPFGELEEGGGGGDGGGGEGKQDKLLSALKKAAGGKEGSGAGGKGRK
ncbi:hypothetical protein HDV00_000722 [Rhizophlyctis rosea]|nr:hypothetical protein HDV00_000722 [Rhizophlyctis rosea]